MRELEINKQTIHYALFDKILADYIDSQGHKTGEKFKKYQTPVEYRINVSPPSGNAEREVFGIECNYHKTMTTADMDCPIDEETILWIGIPTSQPHNYVVVRKAVSLHDIVYAIREVTLSG